MREVGIRSDRPKYLDRSDDSTPCYNLLRISLFFFTALFWILGIVILAVGIAVHTDQEYKQAVTDYIAGAVAGASLFIFVGIAMLLTGFIGCFGAIRESKCLLLTFFFVLFSIFILLVACGIWSHAARTKLEEQIAETLESRVKDYHRNRDVKQAMDSLQTRLRCCGAREGAIDYHQLSSQGSNAVPESCGANRNPEDACYRKVMQQLDAQMTKIGAIGVTVAILMILGMVLTLTLCWQLQEYY